MKKICLASVTMLAFLSCAIYGLIVYAGPATSGLNSEDVSKHSELNPEITEFIQQARLATEVSGDGFAGQVRISGNTAIVTSYAGISVFVRSGAIWSQQATLVPSDGLGGVAPGVAIDGDTIVITRGNTSIPPGEFQGAAYVFVRNGTTWTEQQRLVASDGQNGDGLGASPAINGDTIIVGAGGVDVGANVNQGAEYVFVRSGSSWVEQAKFTASDGAANLSFGGKQSAINGNTVVISTGFGLTSSVYVFVRNGTSWTQQQKLSVCEPSGPSPSNFCAFGKDVSISGDTIAVGNDWLNINGLNIVGGVYIFTRDGTVWSQQQRIAPTDGLAGDHFAFAVSLQENLLLVGAHGNGNHPGAAYLYERTGSTWNLSQPRLQVTPTASNNLFGNSLSLSGNSMIIGAGRDATPPEGNIGAAYVFSNGTFAPSVRSPFDFDGDSKSDISVFRPNGANGAEWWWLRSSDGGNGAVTFGAATDMIVAGDYTGDGKADIAVWRPSNGNWFVLRSEDSSFFAFPFGTSGDVPVPADFDGDGKTDAAVFRPSDVTWYISRSSGGTTIAAFGLAGDKAVPADYDGDGKADIAIFRPNGASGAEWWLQRSSNSTVFAAQFGASTDKTVVGDHTGDGKADIAIWRPSNGDWYVLRSEDQSFYAFPFGTNGDLPTPGDYDGDGKTDAAVFRPSNSTWYAQRSTAGTLIQQFGASGDLPVPNAYVR